MTARTTAKWLCKFAPVHYAVLILVACEASPNNQEPLWDEATEWTIGPEQLRIGANDAQDGHSLFRVRTAIQHPDGRIIVLNGGSNEVRVFDSDGALIRSFGGTGQGPEQFSALASIWLAAGDTVVTYDVGQARLLAWPLSGGSPVPIALDVSQRPTIYGRFASGAYLIGRADQPQRREPGSRWVDSVDLVVAPPSSAIPNQVARLPHVVMFAAPSPGGRGGSILTPLGYSGNASIAVGRAEFYYGFGQEWIITRYAESGTVNDTIRRNENPVQFSQAMLNALIDERVAMMPPEQAPMMRSFIEAFPWPETLAPFQALQLDEIGCLWVQHTISPGAERSIWSVFSMRGRWLGEIQMPSNIRPTRLGGRSLIGVQTNDDGVENVVVHEIVKPEPAANCTG
jgi:hypothetical protein